MPQRAHTDAVTLSARSVTSSRAFSMQLRCCQAAFVALARSFFRRLMSLTVHTWQNSQSLPRRQPSTFTEKYAQGLHSPRSCWSARDVRNALCGDRAPGAEAHRVRVGVSSSTCRNVFLTESASDRSPLCSSRPESTSSSRVHILVGASTSERVGPVAVVAVVTVVHQESARPSMGLEVRLLLPSSVDADMSLVLRPRGNSFKGNLVSARSVKRVSVGCAMAAIKHKTDGGSSALQ
mmetsp:Transcript_79046/g.203611  ORF Transcript_79046/g.203611 Transcript_79046/m.203611 type:complete len:236 (-) Transcript_79046:75-782(-)